MLVRDSLIENTLIRLQEIETFPGYRWNKALARYQDRATGRIVAQKTLEDLGERYLADVTSKNIATMTDKLIDGKWALEKWQVNVAHELKDAYSVETMIGRGGRAAMTPADWGRIGGRLNFQYRHLENFALEIAQGNLTEGQIRMRAQMYANSVRTAFWDGATTAHTEAGFTHEQRFTMPAENCDDCIGYEAQGVVPIGTLPEPGQASACRSNCLCMKVYYKTDEEGNIL